MTDTEPREYEEIEVGEGVVYAHPPLEDDKDYIILWLGDDDSEGELTPHPAGWRVDTQVPNGIGTWYRHKADAERERERLIREEREDPDWVWLMRTAGTPIGARYLLALLRSIEFVTDPYLTRTGSNLGGRCPFCGGRKGGYERGNEFEGHSSTCQLRTALICLEADPSQPIHRPEEGDEDDAA